jgi:hypothetical protein
MRFAAKFVAAVLVIALWATPLSAAMLGSGGAQPTAHCRLCCHGMAMMASADMSANSTMAAGSAAEASAPSCCKLAPGQPAAPVPVREAQGPVAGIALNTHVSAFAAVLPSAAAREMRLAPDRSPARRLHSVLCTFLI